MEQTQQDSQVSNENGEVDIQETSTTQENTPDLSSYFKDGEPGIFDADKVAGLARDLENQKKSTSYFQSQFMKKNGVPNEYKEYYNNFKADSMYEKAMDNEDVKNSVDSLFKWCHENKIGTRESQMFVDYIMKNAVESNIIDMRTDEVIAAEQEKIYQQELEKVQPMLNSLNRTIDENNTVIENFLNSRSVFTNNPEIKDYIKELADKDSKGYMLVTLMTQAFEHSGVPVVTGTSIGSKDKVALMNEYNAESDPVKREALMRAFYGE